MKCRHDEQHWLVWIGCWITWNERTDTDSPHARVCLDCGAWLTLGPANDTPAVRVEVRAAELAARPGFGSFSNCGKGCERCGYVQRGSGTEKNVRCDSDQWHAGYLARCIVEHGQ